MRPAASRIRRAPSRRRSTRDNDGGTRRTFRRLGVRCRARAIAGFRAAARSGRQQRKGSTGVAAVAKALSLDIAPESIWVATRSGSAAISRTKLFVAPWASGPIWRPLPTDRRSTAPARKAQSAALRFPLSDALKRPHVCSNLRHTESRREIEPSSFCVPWLEQFMR